MGIYSEFLRITSIAFECDAILKGCQYGSDALLERMYSIGFDKESELVGDVLVLKKFLYGVGVIEVCISKQYSNPHFIIYSKCGIDLQSIRESEHKNPPISKTRKIKKISELLEYFNASGALYIRMHEGGKLPIIYKALYPNMVMKTYIFAFNSLVQEYSTMDGAVLESPKQGAFCISIKTQNIWSRLENLKK